MDYEIVTYFINEDIQNIVINSEKLTNLFDTLTCALPNGTIIKTYEFKRGMCPITRCELIVCDELNHNFDGSSYICSGDMLSFYRNDDDEDDDEDNDEDDDDFIVSGEEEEGYDQVVAKINKFFKLMF